MDKSQQDVGTAWLLLSHATWIALSISCVAMSVAFGDDKPLAVAWCSGGLAFSVWTLYAVAMTWRSNRQVLNAVFGDIGFSFVVLLVVVVAGLAIGSLVHAASAQPMKRTTVQVQ